MEQMGGGSFQPGTAVSSPTSQVELSVSCRDLIDMDVFSKSDPMCVLFVKEFAADKWREFGRTEIIWNNLNPDFVKKFVVDYFFEEYQALRFEVYDVDSKSPNLRDHDFLGQMDCSLGEIISATHLKKPLKGPKVKKGSIMTVTAEELSACKEEVTLQFSASKLDKKDWFGKSDPFLSFYKIHENLSHTVVHRTEYIKNTLEPVWKPFTISSRDLCGNDRYRSILVKCIDWNRDGSEDLIGEFTTTLDEMVRFSSEGQSWKLEKKHGKSAGKVHLSSCRVGRAHTFIEHIQAGQLTNWSSLHVHWFLVINPTKKYKKGKTCSGTVVLGRCRVFEVPSFVDFVHAGTQLNCTIAIDFTASNGNPMQPGTLHHYTSTTPSVYASAITSVGQIVQDYDSDKLFPVLGFGAKLPPDGRVSHEFFVNLHPSSPYCNGVSGVLDAYYRCLQSVQLYGPTNFSPVINHVARLAAPHKDGSEYFILLILTDGVITDMNQTRDAIVAASTLPLSIIIVGVGNADFSAMEFLDGDSVRLTDQRGRPAQRDIVQFVPFRNFIQSGPNYTPDVSQARLAKEVLAEIPDQFLGYMKANNIAPGVRGRSQGGSAPQAQAPPAHAPQPTQQKGQAPRAPSIPQQGSAGYPQFGGNNYPAGGPGTSTSPEAPPPYPGY